MSKPNFFVKYLKSISKLINSLLEQNLNKLKFNNLINLANSNKIFLSFVALIILFLSYLSFPNIHKQVEISEELKNELLTKFNLNVNFSKNLDYSFFPRPHFISNEADILDGHHRISDVKKIKIYISLENLFSLKNMKVNNVVLEDSNFYLNNKNYNFFIKILDNNFENSKLEIRNSNIFFRNNQRETLFINKILKMTYFYDPGELKNIIYSNNEIFNIPYSIQLIKDEEKKFLYSKLNLNFLKLQIENEYNYKDKIKIGVTNLILNKLKRIITYKVYDDSFKFNVFDKIENPKFYYEGNINFKPFYSSLDGNTDTLNLSYLFDSTTIISQLFKTELFYNKNISFELNINANKIQNFSNFVNVILSSKIEEGLFDIDNTKFEWKNHAKFELLNSLIFIKDNELILDGVSKINVIDHNAIYKFLLTPKNLRKKIKNIDLSYSYNFDQKVINFKDIIIDGKFDQNVNNLIKNLSIKNNDMKNKIYFKNLLNELIKHYAG